MADKTVIVEIQYDTQQAVKNLEALTSSIEGEKVAQAQLKDQLEKGKISQKEYSIEVEKSKDATSKANAERKATIQLLGSEKGSVNELKANIKLLTTERDKLNLSTAEGRKQAEAYNVKIKDMQAALKGASSESQKTRGAFAAFGDSLKNIPGPIGGIISGIMGMTKASLAFIATPIGAVLAAIGLALGALIKYFKGSEEGQNRLNKIVMVFNTIMGNLGDLVQKVGQIIFDAVSKPKETIQKLGDLIKENLINRFKAFAVIGKAIVKILSGDFKQGFKDLAEGGIQAATGIENSFDKIGKAANAARDAIKGIIAENKKEIAIAQNLADRQAALDLLERKHLVNRAKLESEVNTIKSEAVLKEKYSAEERAVMLRKANDLELAILDTDMKITKEKAALKKAQNDLSNSTKEDLNEQARLEADVYNVQKENAQKRMALNSQLNSALKELETEKLKDKEANAEKEIKIDTKAQEEILKRRGQAIWELSQLKLRELELEDKTIEDKMNAQKAAADLERKQKLEEAELLAEEIEVINKEHKIKLLEIDAAYQEELKARRAEELAQTYADLQAIIDATQGMADSKVMIMMDTLSKLVTINADEIKNNKDAMIAIGSAAAGLTNLITAGHQKQLASLKSEQAAELRLVGDNKDAQDKINAKYAKKEEELKKKQFEDNKKKALIDAAIATALAIIKALSSGLPMPGIAMAAFAAIAGGISIASIASQNYTPTPTYAKGGIIGGLPHSQGGTQFVGSDGSRFEAERGEAMFVLKKDATAEIAALSQINESHGGRAWTAKGSSFLADGGEVSTEGIDKAVNEAIQRTPIYVRVADIETGMTEVNNVREAGII